jgi:multiple sugar transport system substrate-binding protein
MRLFFSIWFLILCAASLLTGLLESQSSSGRPVIYWMTDANPTRLRQIALFEDWLAANHYPQMDLRLDTANSDTMKKIIGGVAGDDGDLIDMAGCDLSYFADMGLLDNVTDSAARMGFATDRTFSAAQPQLAIDGRQYLFPANVWGGLFLVNKGTFVKYHQPLPPRRWTLEQFEDAGKRFVAAANADHPPHRIFFTSSVDIEALRRSVGLSEYNETLTRCTLDDPRNVRILKLLHHWRFDERLFPTPADQESFATAGGYGGSPVQLFCNGGLGMLEGGMHLIVQFRQLDSSPDMGVSELPNGGFPNMVVGTRAVGIYAGSRHKDLARYFLAFLASECYNREIIDDADSLPPCPPYVDTPQFLNDPRHRNEWELHAGFALETRQIGYSFVNNPFIIHSMAQMIQIDCYNAYMSGICTAEQAASDMATRTNQEMERSLSESPSLQSQFAQALRLQERIDQLRREGQPVPIDWISNPFLRGYWQAAQKAGEAVR